MTQPETLPHPEYGPCDGLGRNGTCSECDPDDFKDYCRSLRSPDKPETQAVADKRADLQFSLLERRLEIAEHKILVAIPGTEGALNLQLQDAANEVGKALSMVRLLPPPVESAPALAPFEKLAADLLAEAEKMVPSEYADRGLHGKYYRMDTEAAGLVEAADRLSAVVEEVRGKEDLAYKK